MIDGNYSIKNQPEGGTSRGFGLVFSAVFFAFFLYGYFSSEKISFVALGGSATFLFFAIFFPKLLTPLSVAWTYFGFILSKIVNPLVMAALFISMFVPGRLILSLLRKDLLGLQKKKSDDLSYWCSRASEKIDFEEQF